MQEQQKGLFTSTPQEIEPQVDHEEKREKITIYLRSDHIRKLDRSLGKVQNPLNECDN